MTTKLTLSIDEEKVKKIKQISKKRGRSVSKLIEDYIYNIDINEFTEKLDIMKVKGAFGKVPKDFDWKKIKMEYLLEKYVK